ncbi:MAG TPA: hypothetical protein VMC41_03730 [Candidatus Nanoarchaeia archaeon]|nr:hypothetical protein [Candidatus Nanoarchaeia archaeon]
MFKNKTVRFVLIAFGVIGAAFLILAWDWYKTPLKKFFAAPAEQPYFLVMGQHLTAYHYRTLLGAHSTYRILNTGMLVDSRSLAQVILPMMPTDQIEYRLAVSPQGKIFYTNAADCEIHKFDFKTKHDLPAAILGYCSTNPVCSHDGRVLLSEANPSGIHDIYAVWQDSLTNIPCRLTNGLTFCGSPSFSSRDDYFVFDCRDANNYWSLWIYDNKTREQRPLIQGDELESHQRPACSPVSNWIAYQNNIGSSIGIKAALLDGKRRVVKIISVLAGGGKNLNPAWTPDGKKIIFQRPDSALVPDTFFFSYAGKNYFKEISKTIYFSHIFLADFNPDFPQRAKQIEIKGCLGCADPVWLPTARDSVADWVAKFFAERQPGVDSLRRNSN